MNKIALSVPSLVRKQLKRTQTDTEFKKNIRTQWDYIIGKYIPLKKIESYMEMSPKFHKHPMLVWQAIAPLIRDPETRAFRHYVRQHPNKPISKEYIEAFKQDFFKKKFILKDKKSPSARLLEPFGNPE